MKRVIGVVVLGLLAACSGGDSSVGTTTSTTAFSVYGDGGTFGGSGGGSGSSGSSDSDDASVSAGDDGGSASVEEGYCATGTYELDSEDLWAQVIAASGEGGDAEMVSGSATLELSDDLTARLVWNAWTFRLFFPGESDTVLGTQIGEMNGSWAVDDDGAHSIEFSSDTTSGSFVLESAGGRIPVPSGDMRNVPVDIQLFARCGSDVVVLLVPDAEMLNEMAWTFYRV